MAKTHDLSVLLDLVAQQIPSWAGMRNDMVALTDWAVLPRYPGTTAGLSDARRAVERCRKFRKVARRALGLRGK